MSELLPLTMGAVLQQASVTHPDTDALVFPDEKLSYAGLYQRARERARSLMALGVKPGDHVGIHLPTSFEFIECLFGIALVGGVAVPVNGRYVAVELTYLVKNADLVTLITTDQVSDNVNFIDRMHSALPGLEKQADPENISLGGLPMLKNVVVIGNEQHKGCVNRQRFTELSNSVTEEDLDARIAGVTSDDMALILYTSGTTANPKGCMITHGGMVGNSRALGRYRYKLTDQDRFWTPLPIFHIAGILPLIAIMDVCGTYLMMPFFKAGKALKMLTDEKVTATYPCFMTIMQDLIDHPDFVNTDLSRVRLMNSSFAVQPPAIKEAMQKAMPETIQVGTYGLTEAAGTICTSKLDDDYEARTTRLGSPLRGWEVRIIDLESGEVCKTGERGEIIARSPFMLKGYYKDPVKTAETIDAEGWLHTGDIGTIDEKGRIMFLGRTKDMLKVGGENVAASEIESHILKKSGIKIAQVVGVADPRLVEVAAAFIELDDGISMSEEAVIEHCKGQIASFKVPRYVRFVTSWPMSASKIKKYELSKKLSKELGL